MSAIKENLCRVLSTLKDGVELCAVSKYHPEEELQEAYDAGQRIFGESHVQELVRKQAALPKDIEWHFIGHLQTNKVKYIAPFVSLIHSADSPRLIAEINKQGVKCGRRIPILLQLHLAQEESKFGFTIDECRDWLNKCRVQSAECRVGAKSKVQSSESNVPLLPGIEIRGIMTMATYCDDEEQWRREFRKAKEFFEELRTLYSALCTPTILSMGMSHDYHIAMEEGATLVRIGTAIFGERNYD